MAVGITISFVWKPDVRGVNTFVKVFDRKMRWKCTAQGDTRQDDRGQHASFDSRWQPSVSWFVIEFGHVVRHLLARQICCWHLLHMNQLGSVSRETHSIDPRRSIIGLSKLCRRTVGQIRLQQFERQPTPTMIPSRKPSNSCC